jgi:hypothetical protein
MRGESAVASSKMSKQDSTIRYQREDTEQRECTDRKPRKAWDLASVEEKRARLSWI